MSAGNENSHDALTENLVVETGTGFQNKEEVIENEVRECPIETKQSVPEGVGTQVDIQNIRKSDEVHVDIEKGETNQRPKVKSNTKEIDITKCSTEIEQTLSENTGIIDIQKADTNQEYQGNQDEQELKNSEGLIEKHQTITESEDIVDSIKKSETKQGPQDKHIKDFDIADYSTEIKQSLSESVGTVVNVQNVIIVDLQKSETNEVPEINITESLIDKKQTLFENSATIADDVQKTDTDQGLQGNQHENELKITESGIQKNQTLIDSKDIADDIKIVETKQESPDKNTNKVDIADCSTKIKPSLSESDGSGNDTQKVDIVDIQEDGSEHTKKDNPQERKRVSCEEQETPPKKNRTDVCFLCYQSGHKKSKCPKKKQKKGVTECPIEKNHTENENIVDNLECESNKGLEDKNTKKLDIADSSPDMKKSLSDHKDTAVDIQKVDIVDIPKDASEHKKKEEKKGRICFRCGKSGHKKSKCPNKTLKKGVTESPIDKKLPLTESEETFQDIPKVEINQETQDKCQITEHNITEEKQSLIESKVTSSDIHKNDTNECKNDGNDLKTESLEQKQSLTEEQTIDSAQKDDTNQKSQDYHDVKQDDSKTSISSQDLEKSKLCFRCHTVGHLIKACPLKHKRLASENQEGPASKKLKFVICYNCGESDHKRNKCPKKELYEADNTRQSVVNKNATEENDDAKSSSSDSKTLQDSQPELFAGENSNTRLILKKLPKTWTAKDVTHFLHDKCDTITASLKKVVMIRDRKNISWGLEFATASACLEAMKMLALIGYANGQKFICSAVNDQSVKFADMITVQNYIKARRPEMPYPAFSYDLLLNYKVKQRREETFGLNKDFLDHLNITLPLTSKIFVKNLSKEVTKEKLREVFAISGRVMSVILKKDEKSTSARIEFQHALEAVQAISMLHDQELFGEKMCVQQDKFSNLSPLLPSGLSGVGAGLGNDGMPLRDVWDLMEVATVKQKLTDILNQVTVLEQKFKNHDTIINAKNTPQSKMKIPQKNTNVPKDRLNVPQNQINVPQNQMNAPQNQMNAPHNQMNAPHNQMNVPHNQMNVPHHMNMPVMHMDMQLPNPNMPPMQMHMPQYPTHMQQNPMPAPHHIQPILMAEPLYQMNMPEHHINVPANPMDVMQQYPTMMPQAHVDVPQNQISGMAQNQFSAAPQNQISAVPQNQISAVPHNQISAVPHETHTPPYYMQEKKTQLPEVLGKSSTKTIDPKIPSPVQSKAVSQSKDRTQSELQQIKAVREFMASIRAKERESPDVDDRRSRHRRSSVKVSSSSDDDYDSPPYPKKRRSTSVSKERRNYGDSGSSRSKYSSKDTISKRTEWKTSEKSQPVQSDRLLFTNLPRSVTAKALESKMSELGELRWVEFIRMGRAVVRFKDVRDAARCLKLYNASKVDGQTIYVTYDDIS